MTGFLMTAIVFSLVLTAIGIIFKVVEIRRRVSVVREYFNGQKYRIENKFEEDERVYIFEQVSGFVREIEFLNEKRLNKNNTRGDIHEVMKSRLNNIKTGNTIVIKNGVPVSKNK